ncbi:MAG: PilZ domain-containing protein [Acidobacteriota bacterium]
MSPRGDEKRLHDRVQDRLTLQTLSSDHGTIRMETTNLSLGGVYCHSDRSIPPMTRLRLSIFLPSSDGRPAKLHYPLEVDAVVVRSDPLDRPLPGLPDSQPAASFFPENGHGSSGYRLALFFDNMKKQDRRVLARYLASISTQ